MAFQRNTILKILFGIGIIIIALFLIYFFFGTTLPQDPIIYTTNLLSCTTNSDCQLYKTSCCDCQFDAMNKSEEAQQRIDRGKEYCSKYQPNVQCNNVCVFDKYAAACVKGSCKIVSTIGFE
jgi:hypothetical protein